MRLFTATLATETNTFSPLPTSIENYRESVFLRPGEHPADAPRMCTAPLFVGRKRAEQEGFELIEGSCFAASPAGTTNRADYETMRDEILDQLKAAMPVDGLLLGLHGAMVAHGYDDVEGDIIERVRAIVGPGCTIGLEPWRPAARSWPRRARFPAGDRRGGRRARKDHRRRRLLPRQRHRQGDRARRRSRRHRAPLLLRARGGGRGRGRPGAGASRGGGLRLPRPSRRRELCRSRRFLPLAGGAGRDAARPQRLPTDRHSGRRLLTATPRQKISPGLVASSSGQIGRSTLV
jgi:hypothetical protein